MADFKLKFSVNTSVNTGLPVLDKTGVYSSTPPLNLTGWNSGLADMPSISQVQTATLTVTTKDTAIPYEINVFPTLPNITDAPFTILPSMIGYTTSIPDQILQIVYKVTGILANGNPFTFSVGCYFLVGVNINCCRQNKIEEAASEIACQCEDPCKCTCKNRSKTFKAMQAQVMYIGLQQLVANRQINKANAVLSLLQNLCSC